MTTATGRGRTLRDPSSTASLRLLVGIEYAKLRRLGVGLIALLLAAATVLFASSGLFSTTGRHALTSGDPRFWPGHVIGTTMATALLSPMFLAAFASRVVDVENTGRGWGLYATAGIGPGRQCRAKWLALLPVVTLVQAVVTAGSVAIPVALGAPPPGDPATLLLASLECLGTSLVLLALHVWLAARNESQVVGIGLGLVGSLVGLLSMLAPPWLAAVTPWGYYALVLPYSYDPTGIVAIAPHHLPWAMFCAAGLAAFALLTRRLDLRDQ